MNAIEDLVGTANMEFTNLLLNYIGGALSSYNECAIIQQAKEKYLEANVKLIQHRKVIKNIMSIHGLISYERTELVAKDSEQLSKLHQNGAKSVAPLDCCLGVWNLPHKLTPNAMLLCTSLSLESYSYEETHKKMEELLGLDISADVIRRVANEVGNIQYELELKYAEEIDQKRINETLEIGSKNDDITYILTDGSYILCRPEDIGNAIYVADCDKRVEYREVKLAAIFRQSDIVMYTSKTGKKRHKIKNVIMVPYLGEAETFNKLVYASCYKYGYLKSNEFIILADGAKWITSFQEEYFPLSCRILDLFHIIEKIHDCAKERYPNNSKARKYFIDTIIGYLLDGEKEKALSFVLSKSLEWDDEKGNIDLYKYLNDNYLYIDYKEYIDKGYFVGSGLIESRNKSFVHRRMKQPGMKWYPINANRVLFLKAKKENNQWNEVKENLAAKYANIFCKGQEADNNKEVSVM